MGPSFLKFHYVNQEPELLICSQNGYFQFRKLTDQQELNTYQKVTLSTLIDLKVESGDTPLTAIDISSNGACLLFADQIGYDVIIIS